MGEENLMNHDKGSCPVQEELGDGKQELYKESIVKYRDGFRPVDRSPSGMLITNDEPEIRYTSDKDGKIVLKKVDDKTRNRFDESTYTYFPEMVISKRRVTAHNILITKIKNEYKRRYLRSKRVTHDNIEAIVRWTIQNPESILVMECKMPKYAQIKLLFERLSDMGVLHLLYSDKDLNIIKHKEVLQDDGSIKLVKTNTTGKTIPELHRQSLVDVKYYRIGVIATYQTMDHTGSKYMQTPFPFPPHEDD